MDEEIEEDLLFEVCFGFAIFTVTTTIPITRIHIEKIIIKILR